MNEKKRPKSVASQREIIAEADSGSRESRIALPWQFSGAIVFEQQNGQGTE
jgi:hypothetical protein